MKINYQRQKFLYYIAFIKYLATIKIIKWHIYKWKKRPIDYGARMCEFLFASSGFLVGYNHYQKNMLCDYETSFKYSYKSLRTFYPLLFLNTLYGFFFKKGKKNDLSEFIALLSNLTLINIFIRKTKYVAIFNAISWFLSDLLLCYFLVPLLLKGIKNIKISLILFLIISLIRISIEEILLKRAFNMFDINIHRGPIIRLLEFYMGMLITPIFLYIKNILDKYKHSAIIKILFTFIQIKSTTFIYYIMKKYNRILSHCYFVLIFCIFIFIIGFDYGFLSILLSHKIPKIIMSCQMEIYLTQLTVNNIIKKVTSKINFGKIHSEEKIFLMKLLIIFFVGYLYKKLYKEKFASFLDRIFCQKIKPKPQLLV